MRERQKEGRNKQVRRCTEKYSYTGHWVSENRKAVSERRQEKPSATLYRKNTHNLVIGFRNSNVFISNERKLGKIYCERKISEIGDPKLQIEAKP